VTSVEAAASAFWRGLAYYQIAMRAPTNTIAAPPFPPMMPWVNVAPLRMDQQLGRPVLIEFWDFCRPNSMRTLPYMQAWHERYADAGLRVIGVHSAGFEPSKSSKKVRAAVQRLEIEYPVVIDVGHQIWQEYENLGWPARYLWGPDGMLFDYHYGEGAYDDTERAIQELLGVERELLVPLKPEENPEALIVAQSDDQLGPYSGPYAAGGVWGVFDGSGTATVNGQLEISIPGPGAYELLVHEQHTEAEIEIDTSEALELLAVCFTPGLAPA
jgi:thiol-disulfide isomerase/thioredoxin